MPGGIIKRVSLGGWSADPAVLLGLALAAGVYGHGWVRLRRRSGQAAKPLEAVALLFQREKH